MERRRNRASGDPASADAQSSDAGESLSGEELRQVLQRAASLEQAKSRSVDAAPEPSLDFREVERIGVESGLSREAIQKAFVELRTGALQPLPQPSFLDRLLGPKSISAQATSPLDAEEARRKLEEILKGELLHPADRNGARTEWEPTPGLWASIQRGVNLQGQSTWQHAQIATEVFSASAGSEVRSMVKIEARPRGRNAIFAALVPFALLAGFAVLASQNPIGFETEVFGAVLGFGSVAGLAAMTRAIYQKKLKKLRLALSRAMEKFSV